MNQKKSLPTTLLWFSFEWIASNILACLDGEIPIPVSSIEKKCGAWLIASKKLWVWCFSWKCTWQKWRAESFYERLLNKIFLTIKQKRDIFQIWECCNQGCASCLKSINVKACSTILLVLQFFSLILKELSSILSIVFTFLLSHKPSSRILSNISKDLLFFVP